MGITKVRFRTVLTLIGVLALAAGFTAVSVQADGGGGASAAKKCKKKHGKKKKCKKHVGASAPATPALPITAKPPTPPAPPVTRAVLDWTSSGTGADLDLEVFNAAGDAGCLECAPPQPPGFSFSGTADKQTDGEEALDDINNPSTQKLAFVACAFDVDADADWKLDVQYADGSTDSATGTATTGTTGRLKVFNDPGGGFDASMADCPS